MMVSESVDKSTPYILGVIFPEPEGGDFRWLSQRFAIISI